MFYFVPLQMRQDKLQTLKFGTVHPYPPLCILALRFCARTHVRTHVFTRVRYAHATGNNKRTIAIKYHEIKSIQGGRNYHAQIIYAMFSV